MSTSRAGHVQALMEDAYRAVLGNWLKDDGLARTPRQNLSLGIVVVGEAGLGKSSLINGLLGKRVATVGKILDPGTIEMEKFSYTQNGVAVTLWDTPGFGVLSEEEDEEIMRQILALDKIDLILFCVKMTDNRWPKRTDRYTIHKMTEVLGEEVWNHCQFVLTFANYIDDNLHVFSERMKLFEQKLKKALVKEGAIHQDQAIHIVPTGDPRRQSDSTWRLKLPGIDDWFDNFWLECTSTIDQSAVKTLIRLNKHRMNDVPIEYVQLTAQQTDIPLDSQAVAQAQGGDNSSLNQVAGSSIEDVMEETAFDTSDSISEASSIQLVLRNVETQTDGPAEEPQTENPAEEPHAENTAEEPGLEWRELSFYRTLQRQLERDNSNLAEYIRRFARERGEQVNVVGQIGGFFEGICAWIGTKLAERR